MRVRAAVVLPVPVLLLAAACGGGESAPPPALSKDEAQRVLARYADAANKAGQRLDGDALAAVETDPQLAMDRAAFRLGRAARRPFTPVRFVQSVFYIPRMQGYPRWFAADTVTSATPPGAKQPRTTRHALVFTQAAAGAPWLLAASPHPGGDEMSRVRLDGDGYAQAVAPGASGLAVSPSRIGAAHAALLSGGPQAPGAGVLAPGPQTTQSYDALRQAQVGLRKNGVRLHTRFTPDSSPVYALRTKDGGALVWYVLRQHESYRAARLGKLAVTGDLTGLAPAKAARTRLDATVLVQYLATVPASGHAAVGGMYRKAVAARAS
ncbi:hypothetical protein [Actinomadura keratinilytica]|jgi:hypothetical protein|uniref:DUF8094 domain-containing protein n=1 Tax=Actinomadura keratinilytica TaxID=547461 RepID=A0ABP7YQN3_9ACTN